MNNLAVVPYIGMHALQIQNVKRNIVKKASVSELNHEIIQPLETQDELEMSQMGNHVGDDVNENGTNIDDLPAHTSNDIVNNDANGNNVDNANNDNNLD
jgi:hypothetical protein